MILFHALHTIMKWISDNALEQINEGEYLSRLINRWPRNLSFIYSMKKRSGAHWVTHWMGTIGVKQLEHEDRYYHLVLALRMHGAVPLLFRTLSWWCAWVSTRITLPLKGKKVTRMEKLRSEHFDNFNSLLNIVKLISWIKYCWADHLNGIRWEEHVASRSRWEMHAKY
jgi:hypothetical protein